MPDNSEKAAKPATGHLVKQMPNRAYVPVRLLDLDSFVRNYVEIYDKVNDNDRAILLLTRVWFPAQRAALASVNNHVKR